MAAAIKQTPQSYTLLHVQCEFLRSKGKHEWALKLARQAVNCAPSEFVTWEKLTEIYIDLGMFDQVWLVVCTRGASPDGSTGTSNPQLMPYVHL